MGSSPATYAGPRGVLKPVGKQSHSVFKEKLRALFKTQIKFICSTAARIAASAGGLFFF